MGGGGAWPRRWTAAGMGGSGTGGGGGHAAAATHAAATRDAVYIKYTCRRRPWGSGGMSLWGLMGGFGMYTASCGGGMRGGGGTA